MADTSLNGVDWSTAGHWDNGKPADNDSASIPATNDNRAITMGDEGGVDVDLLTVHHGFKGTMGTSASPIGVAADLIRVYGSSGFYWENDHDDVAEHTVDKCILQCRNNSVPVELGSKTTVGAGSATWTNVWAKRGHVTIKANLLWTASGLLEVGYVGSPANDVQAILAASEATLPLLRQNGGRVESQVVITAGEIMGGTLVQDTATPVLIHVYSGATLVLNHTAATTIEVHDGGTLDLLQNARFKTITTLTLHPKANIRWLQDVAATPGLHTVGTLNDYRAGPD